MTNGVNTETGTPVVPAGDVMTYKYAAGLPGISTPGGDALDAELRRMNTLWNIFTGDIEAAYQAEFKAAWEDIPEVAAASAALAAAEEAAETAARNNGDNSLQSQINLLSSKEALATEVSSRTAANAAMQSQIGQLASPTRCDRR